MNDNNYTPERRRRPRPSQPQQGNRRTDGYRRESQAGGRPRDAYDRGRSGAGQYVNDDGWGSNAGSRRPNQGGGPQRRIPNDDYQRNPKKRKKRHTAGKIIAVIQAILSLFVLGVLFILNILPMMYLGLIALVLVLLWVFAFFSQFTRKSHIPGKIESVLISIALIFGSYYLLITQNMLSQITSLGYTVDKIVVLVMKDDPAQSLKEAAGYTFGVQKSFQTDKIEQAVSDLNEKIGQNINTQTYDSLQAQIQALYDGQVGAIIYNEGFQSSATELFPNFVADTRELDKVEIKTKVVLDESNTSDKAVTKEPFSIYISGNDQSGSVSIQGRSDVNIIAYVNPNTKQILLVTTPRDYYIEFPGVTNGTKDKLTHASNYGINCSMNTLEGVYGVDLDYYVRVNFTSLIRMVDALGGVDVYSDYAFSTFDGKHFVEGINHLNGEDALSFSRERKSLQGGDFERGRHQMMVLQAMIQKAMSPAILTGYAGIMSSLQDSFITSMPSGDITSLIKMMLEDSSGWNIVTANAGGTGSTQYCYSLGSAASVVIPDENSIAQIKTQIQSLYNGEVLTQTEQN